MPAINEKTSAFPTVAPVAGDLVTGLKAGANANFDVQAIADLAPAPPPGSVSSRFLWQYRANDTAFAGYPGDGRLLWDNAVQIAATTIELAHITQDNLDIDIFQATLASGQSFVIQDANDSTNFQNWTISGPPVNTNPGTPTSYWSLPVTLDSSGGTGTTNFPNNHQLIFATLTTGGGGGGPVIQNIVTGAAPVDIDLNADVVKVTSGGTGGLEVLNVPDPTPDASGRGNPFQAGKIITIEYVTQTAPGDVVQITKGGNFQFSAMTFTQSNIRPVATTSGVQLVNVGDATSFVLAYDTSFWAPDFTDFDYGNIDQITFGFIFSFNTSSAPNSNGGQFEVQAGDATANANGGSIVLRTGNAAGVGVLNGGDLIFNFGALADLGRNGLFFPNLPTVDPGVSGAAWNNAGVVTISP